jgi:hypothetical protein
MHKYLKSVYTNEDILLRNVFSESKYLYENGQKSWFSSMESLVRYLNISCLQSLYVLNLFPPVLFLLSLTISSFQILLQRVLSFLRNNDFMSIPGNLKIMRMGKKAGLAVWNLW